MSEKKKKIQEVPNSEVINLDNDSENLAVSLSQMPEGKIKFRYIKDTFFFFN